MTEQAKPIYKNTWAIAASILLVLAAYIWFKPTSAPQAGTFQGLPWQIDVISPQQSRVFGVTIGSTTLKEVPGLLGSDSELAVLQLNDTPPRLELYYQRFAAGPILGNLILSFDVTPSTLQTLMADSSVSFTPTGSRKYPVGDAGRKQLADRVVKQLLFIPSSQLDEEMIRSRFGADALVDQPEPEVKRFRYPNLGLEIALHQQSKDLLRYVAPAALN